MKEKKKEKSKRRKKRGRNICGLRIRGSLGKEGTIK